MKRESSGNSICVGCGLCCDGTLHPQTNVAADEIEATRSAGLPLQENEGTVTFRQPCPMFLGNCCSIYSMRPPVCRRYRCALLKNVEAGRISSKLAREKIATAKALLAAAKATAPEARTSADRAQIWSDLKARYAELPESNRLVAARGLLDIAALKSFLDRWFREKKSDGSPGV